MRDSKIKYKSKEGHEVIHYRINGTSSEHRADLEKIKKEIDIKYGLVVLMKRRANKGQLEFNF
jgi:hypothetical protein|tara:strand:+ start:112 stop:300 length:189 start_codon:yes stop_codon:yes gene_type:complete